MGKNRSSNGTTNSGGATRVTWENAGDDPEKLAELTGMTFQELSKGSYEFYDAENDFRVIINKKLLDEFKESPLMLNRVMRILDELPDINRKATPGMYFVSSFEKSSIYGKHSVLKSKLDKQRLGHNTAISGYALVEDDAEILRVMLHETSHALDYMLGDDYTTGGFSASKKFKDALKQDGSATDYSDNYKLKYNKYGFPNGEYSQKSLYSKDSNYLLENFAEANSIVQLKMKGYGSTEVEAVGGNYITVDEWVDSHPNLYRVLSENMSTVSEADFVKSENVSHQAIDMVYSLL